MQPRIAVIILNWNGYNDTISLINSLKKVRKPAFKIIIIDNNSNNNEGEKLKKMFGESLEVLINSANLGYAGGNNSSLKYLITNDYEFVLIINNDVIVEADFLEPLIEALESDSFLGLACPLVRDYTSPEIIQSAGGMIHIATGTVRLLHKIPQKKYVDFAPGSCFLIRTSLWKKLHGFDEKFFLYWEEVDLAIRANNLGYKSSVVPNSVVFHKTAASSHYLSKTYIYFMLRNQLYFMRKHCPPLFIPLYLFCFFSRNVLGYTIFSIFKKSPGLIIIPKAIHDGFRSSLTNPFE